MGPTGHRAGPYDEPLAHGPQSEGRSFAPDAAGGPEWATPAASGPMEVSAAGLPLCPPGACSRGVLPLGAVAAGEVAPARPLPVYAIGRIEPRFPSEDLEREVAQVASRGDGDEPNGFEILGEVLRERGNRYIARRLCWVLTVDGLDAYSLVLQDPTDLELLIDAIGGDDDERVDVVVGEQARATALGSCAGLSLPTIAVDVIYSFDRGSFASALRDSEGTTDAGDALVRAVDQVLDRVARVGDNVGLTDEHRALNYLAVRYPAIYGGAAEAMGRGLALTGVETRVSARGGSRRIVEVSFVFGEGGRPNERHTARVDVTGTFPFLTRKLVCTPA